MSYHGRLLAPIQSMLGIYTSLLTGGVSLGRVFEILDVPVEVQDPEFPKPLAPFTGEVCFSNVSFRYSPHVPVLEDVSFTLRKGGLYALAGPSGVGKSTIGDLLVRFFDVQGGSIKIDGTDIREVKLSDLRTMIAVVEQTPYLFHASIRENIAYGRPSATLDEIKTCALQAGIHRFIDGLPEGYETMVGERGVTLSVGERQRIALTRALLRDPALLILDEPTSALDPGSEAIVTDELASNLRGRTTLVITHRLSLIEAADYAFVIEGGRIVEDGPPESLLGKSGYLSRHFRFKGDEILEEVSAS
jgi:ABC-type multidrug transport system fused ATPase/permease subunit